MSKEPSAYNLFDYTPTKGDMKKLEITKAAIECLSEVGIEKTTFEAIAQKIGTRRAHIAYHFPEKHKIYLSAIKYVLATYQGYISDAVKNNLTGHEKLNNYVRASFSWMGENPNQVTVLMLMFYLCAMEHDFMDYYSLVREKELERIKYILREDFENTFTKERADFIAKTIWNTVHSEIMIVVTNKGKVPEKALTNSLSTLDFLLK